MAFIQTEIRTGLLPVTSLEHYSCASMFDTRAEESWKDMKAVCYKIQCTAVGSQTRDALS